MSDYESFSE